MVAQPQRPCAEQCFSCGIVVAEGSASATGGICGVAAPAAFVQLCGHVNVQAEGGAGGSGAGGSARRGRAPLPGRTGLPPQHQRLTVAWRLLEAPVFPRRNWEGPASQCASLQHPNPGSRLHSTARMPHEPGRVTLSPRGRRAASHCPCPGGSVRATEVLVARVALTGVGSDAHAARRVRTHTAWRPGSQRGGSCPCGPRVVFRWAGRDWLGVTAPALCAWPSSVPRDEDVVTSSGAGPWVRPPRDGARGVMLTLALQDPVHSWEVPV